MIYYVVNCLISDYLGIPNLEDVNINQLSPEWQKLNHMDVPPIMPPLQNMQVDK